MTIDFKKFPYEITAFRHNNPVTLPEPVFPENSVITFEFKKLTHSLGFGLTVISQIKVSDHSQSKVVLFHAETDFVIPDQKPISYLNKPDTLETVDKAVYLEFLYHHLSRECAIILSATTGKCKVILPNMLSLYQQIDLLQ